MLSVRLNTELERQLEFLAMTSGLSKNQLVTAAIEQYLKLQDLGTIPLEQQVQEASYATSLHARKLQEAECQNAVMTANWARSGGIWSAKPNPSGEVTGAIYGRNLVIGYSWSQDDKVIVISKHLPPNPYTGADAYSYNLTSFEDWKKYMQQYNLS
ncbi:CopG family transcriptional regulator [Ectopseudomonas mendocina]|jgi:hypothetical protein|uniref:CopG family transcriptional regulator n=1 Tax=Ectopseudomonas mendocina TaxID=300 RepID=A0ABD7RQ54_ECTME|nr:CopG family transcriptional regulator [Pseudomonas mendocina]TRO10410.1 CopG family transcriptional regulator [Pseudomonas mendocina]TRO12286.1 CopG family transcriptional regulator [Pseudomonas mendocina]